jgi:hypothetical protein
MLAGTTTMDDEWVAKFGGKVAPRLKEIFESEIGDLPEPLMKLLQLLQESEQMLPAAA